MPYDTSAIRRLARSRGLSTKFATPNYSLFEGETLKFTGDEGAARKFLLAIPGNPRGRPQGYIPPKKAKKPKPASVVAPHDYLTARRVGGYVMKVEDGVVRLWADDQLVFESRDVERLRLFFKNARAGIVPRAKAHMEKEKARFLRVAAQAQRVEARTKATAERKRKARLKALAAPAPGLAPDDPGTESEDFTPDNYQGLVLTWVALPRGISGDLGLASLWALENTNPFRPSAAVRAEIAKAKRALKRGGFAEQVWLSDHDRASLARYRAEPSVVLTAAALARRAVSPAR